MKLKTEQFRDACTTIKGAIDSKGGSLYTETLELIGSNNHLSMNVTNREYLASVGFTTEVDNFFASVNAKLFLDLISKITTDEIELEVLDTYVKVVGNGTYKVPLVFNGDKLMELPKIEAPKEDLGNYITMTVPSKTLLSILTHNSKELQRGTPVKPVQKYYYVDETGAITFTSGACVNSFALPVAIKMLLSDKVVKLFKLFKDVTDVDLTYGLNSQNQTVVRFSATNIALSAILQDVDLINSVPVAAIRNMASKNYAHSLSIKKDDLLDALHRIKLFSTEKVYGTFTFSENCISIKDWSGENVELISTLNTCSSLSSAPYSAILNINGLELIVGGCEDETLTLSFGDGKAVVIHKSSVSDIIPELKQS